MSLVWKLLRQHISLPQLIITQVEAKRGLTLLRLCICTYTKQRQHQHNN